MLIASAFILCLEEVEITSFMIPLARIDETVLNFFFWRSRSLTNLRASIFLNE